MSSLRTFAPSVSPGVHPRLATARAVRTGSWVSRVRSGGASARTAPNRESSALRSPGTVAIGATVGSAAAAVAGRRRRRCARKALVVVESASDLSGIDWFSARQRHVVAKSAQLRQDLAELQRAVSDLARSTAEAARPEPTPLEEEPPTRSAAPAQAAPEALAATRAPREGSKSSGSTAEPLISSTDSTATPSASSSGGSGATPSAEVLGSLFDLVCTSGDSRIGLAEIEQVVDLLNLDYRSLGLQRENAPAIRDLLRGIDAADARAADGTVSRHQLVAGLGRLLRALERIGKAGFNLLRMKSVLVAVFERFDVDKDGSISEAEFAAGLRMLGLDVAPEDASILHSFISPDEGLQAQDLVSETSLEEKASSILKGGADLLDERFHFGSLASLKESVAKAMKQSTGGPLERLQQLAATAWNEAEDVCEVAEGAVELASFAVGAQYCLHGLESGLAEGMDVAEVAPIVILLSILGVKINKDLSELVPRSMTEDEALLYWGSFQKHGLSQASFQTLLACESCRWGVAEAGEVLSTEEDKSLRIVVKGPVAVTDGTKVLKELPNGMVIGDTTYLGGSPLWNREAIVAQSQVTYIHWDIKCLGDCMAMDRQATSAITALLSDSMVSNLRVASRLRADMTAEDVKQPKEPSDLPDLETSSYTDVFNVLDIDGDGVITKEELSQSLDACSFIFRRMNFSPSESEFERLFNFLDTDRDGFTTREEFTSRLKIIEEWAQNLAERDMSLGDLSFVLVRAHAQIDENGDGLISQEEFWAALRRLDLPLDHIQSNALHSYLDRDGDGLVDVDEWQASSKEIQVLAAFKDIMGAQAEKKGLTKFAYFNRQIMAVLQGPEEPAEKLRACMRIAWDGIESLGEVASLGLDLSGFAVALVGISQQFAGLANDGDGVDQLDLAPFLLFLGVSAVQILRKLVEDSARDLSDREALLFAKAFGGTDISLADFRKLLRHGAPRWRNLSEGDVLMESDKPDGSLHVVMNGNFDVSEGQGGLRTSVSNGGFLCGDDSISNTSAMAAVAGSTTTTLSFSAEKLRPILERSTDMKMKLQRAVTSSMAAALLRSHSTS